MKGDQLDEVIADPFGGLPPSGFVRLNQIIAPDGPLPISKSSLWAWVKAERFPAPVKLGPRVTVWDSRRVRAFIAEMITEPNDSLGDVK